MGDSQGIPEVSKPCDLWPAVGLADTAISSFRLAERFSTECDVLRFRGSFVPEIVP